MSADDAHHIEFKPTLLHQALALTSDLLYEATTYGTHTTDEEVEHLVLREEERVVNHVQRLTQQRSIDNE